MPGTDAAPDDATMTTHLVPTRSRPGNLAMLAAPLGLALVVLAGVAVATNADRRFPGSTSSWSLHASLAVGVASAGVAVVCGAGLALRAPRNPTGLRFVMMGGALAAWLAASFWPARVAPLVAGLLVAALRPLLYLSVLAWPAGRFERRYRRRLAVAVAAAAGLSWAPLVLRTVEDGDQPWGWTSWPLPQIGSLAAGRVATAFVQLAYPAAAVAVLVAIVHRRRRLPPAVRPLTSAAVLGGIVAAAADLWLFALDYVARPVVRGGTGAEVVGFLAVVLDYARFGAVPALFLFDAVRRTSRRSVSGPAGGAAIEVDLDAEAGARGPGGGAGGRHRGLTALLADTSGDPDLRLLWRQGGRWLDEQGRVVSAEPPPGRRRTTFVTSQLTELAAVEHDGHRVLAPSLIDAAAAAIASSVGRRRAEAEAVARLAELRAQQRALIDAQDRARRRLERDLHDGSQQQLVGLALQARLEARQAGPADVDARDELAGALRRAGEALLAVVAAERPAALAAGLGPALASLAAGAPVETSLTISGPTAAPAPDGADPAAGDGAANPADPVIDDREVAAWYLACEAVTNAVKHAGASRLAIRLVTGPGAIHLEVADDGIGGLDAVPPSLAERAAGAGATVTVRPGPDRGSIVAIEVPGCAPAVGAAR